MLKPNKSWFQWSHLLLDDLTFTNVGWKISYVITPKAVYSIIGTAIPRSSWGQIWHTHYWVINSEATYWRIFKSGTPKDTPPSDDTDSCKLRVYLIST